MDFQIGKITATHGLNGDVKVYPTTDDPKRFKLLSQVYIQQNNITKIYSVENVRFHKHLIILKLKGINSIDQALTLKGAHIRIPKEMSLPLSEDEYYIKDIYDLNVYDGDTYLGTIVDIIQTGANDVYVVKGTTQILLPAIKSCILNIDTKSKTMNVKLPKGLI